MFLLYNKIPDFPWLVQDEFVCIVRLPMTGPVMSFDTIQQRLSNFPTLGEVLKYQADLLSKVIKNQK
jgi:hypothetical protein